MNVRFLLLTTLLILRMAVPSECGATIYSFTDDKGIVHYTNVPSDPRYRPLIRGANRSGGGSVNERLFDRYIREAARLYGFDPLLIKAIIKQESNFDRYARSAKGAVGLMQLMPDTARDMHVTDLYDPRENIFGGTRYLHRLSKLFNGDLKLALASYNAGPDRVRLTRTIPDIRETKDYVRSVLAHYSSYRRQLAADL